MIKAVFIDIDNTLLDFNAFVKFCIKKGFEEFGIAEYDDSMYDAFKRVNDGLWLRIEDKSLSFEELKKIRWNLVFREIGVEFDGVFFEKYFRKVLSTCAIHVDGALDMVKYLSEKYIICSASNGPYEQQVNRLEIGGFGDYIKYHFISEGLGASKPANEFFDRAFDILNEGRNEKIRPEETIMIGDSETSDMQGGINAGMKTCFFNFHKITPKGKYDIVIDRLDEIKNYL